MKPEYKPFVDALIELAIREDIGDGDHTSLCCIPATEKGRMRLLCKQEGILAGIEIAQLVLRRLDPDMQFEQILRDGDRVKPGDVAFYVSGRLQSLLQAERILLNIMQRMSGVATQTAVYADKIKDLHTKVLDTRKTTPGMRVLDKMAGVGGSGNLAKHYKETSFFGIVEVIKNLRTIRRQMKECRQDVEAFAPDVLILVDYPGFNMKMARWAKEHGIRVFYYIAPKVWAWREWRVKAIRKYVDELFIIFPFERDYFPKHGIRPIFEGNPLVDAIEARRALTVLPRLVLNS